MSNITMHHYECVVLYDQFWAVSSSSMSQEDQASVIFLSLVECSHLGVFSKTLVWAKEYLVCLRLPMCPNTERHCDFGVEEIGGRSAMWRTSSLLTQSCHRISRTYCRRYWSSAAIHCTAYILRHAKLLLLNDTTAKLAQ